MKFKKIEFKDKNTQRVYDNYIKSVETAVKPLSENDRLDILMEMNSHIYENMQIQTDNSEMDRLLSAIDRLGTPEEVLRPLIADKMLDKATKTFNPLHILRALVFNLANGISYVIFAFLYLFLFTFIFLIGAKIFNPDVGMYFKDGSFQALGLIRGEDYYEVLGNWFIPFMIVITVALYLFITLLLKFKRSLSKSKSMKSVITTIALLFTLNVAFSQSTDFSKLDTYFEVLEENDRFNGSIAVSKGGEIIYEKSIGFADLENDLKNNSETKFRIGSISKTFTSVLIMKGVEMDKINLDQTIEIYFPKIQNAEKITVRQLLNHTSGIHNFTNDEDYFDWHTSPISEEELLVKIIEKGVDFAPGEKDEYSNSNYVLLTLVLEKAFDQSFEELLTKYIIKPLNLARTEYGDKIETEKNEAFSYRMKSEWETAYETDMSVPLGAGAIVSTPTDLCKFSEALFSGKIVSKNSLEQMYPVGEDWYGFALYGEQFDERTGMGHGGAIDSFTSSMSYFEDDDITYAMTCNGANFGRNDVSIAVLSEIFGESYDIPSFELIELSDEDLDKYLGIYETEEFPMDFTITKEEGTLFLQATGQSSSPMTANGDHKFSIMSYGVKIQFVPEEKKMNFEQNGMSFVLTLKDPSKETESVEEMKEPNPALEKYTGTYESDDLPMDLTISVDGDSLIGQGTGQPSFSLIDEGNDVFTNKQIGLEITFNPDENKMSFSQGGASFEMTLKE